MKTIRPTRALIIAAVWLLAPAFASAATITITDRTDGPPTFALTGFPIGLFSDCTATPEQLNCSFVFFDPAPRDFGATLANAIFLFEDPSGRSISDTFAIFRATSGLLTALRQDNTFQFNSDPDELGIAFVPRGIVAIETGEPQIFKLPSFCSGCIDITVILTSDLDKHSTVPAPATFALVGLGLAGMGLSRRRHLRKS